MKLVTYRHQGQVYLGRLDDQQITPLNLSPQTFYQRGLAALADLQPSSASPLNLAEVTLEAMVPSPGKILCVGLNYRQHAAESQMVIPATPILFSKFSNALAGHQSAIPIAPNWQAVDYEAELLVVIGREARYVTIDQALDYVLGYACANDLSERSLQLGQPGGQWLLGKTLDKFLPIGPYLVTADEIPDPQNLMIRGWLNGELRQDSRTADMIFSVAEIIAFASSYMTLYPGDLISTGTPAGVILGMADKHYLKPGDTFMVEITGLGCLSNTLVEE